MLLNDFQKELVGDINQSLNSEKRIKDINSFFELKCKIKQEKHSCPWIPEKIKNTTSNDIYKIKNDNIDVGLTLGNKSIIFEDRDGTYFATLYFLELIDFLEKNKLITIVEKDPDDLKLFKVPIIPGDILSVFGIDPVDDRMWLLIKEFVLTEFVPLPDLDKFISNGFKTEEDVIAEEEIQSRKHQIDVTRKTLRITIVALCVSVVFNIVSIIVYNTNRNITIVEDKTKSDTNNVKIVNYPVTDTAKKLDTIEIRK